MTSSKPPTVRSLMTSELVTVRLEASFQEAATLMDSHGVSGLPVVDAGGRLAGVISQTDLVRSRATEHLWDRWPGLTVRHLMTAPALTIEEGASIDEAAALMERHRIHRLVVVAADDPARPVGILSTTDLVRAIAGRAS